MVDLSWVCCGVAPVRLELFGLVDDEAPDAPRLLSLTGIRAVHLEGDTLHEIARVQVQEILLDDAIELAPLEATAAADGERATSTIAGLPGRVVVEGIEGADGRFLDLIGMTGWKLVLEPQGDLDFACAWFLFGDWPIDTHPDYFPGTTIGEVSFEGRFGPAAASEHLAIELPWPFAAGRLPIVSPVRRQGRWRAGLDVSRLGGSVFDGMGRALRDFSLGAIDLSSAARSAVSALPGGLTDAVRLEAGLDEHGQRGLRLAIMVHDEIALGELAGQRLVLSGGAGLFIDATFEASHVRLDASFGLRPGSGLRLEGQLIARLDEAAAGAREVIAMIPRSIAADVPPIPEIRLALTLAERPGLDEADCAADPDGMALRVALGTVRIPTRWDVLPIHTPRPDFLADVIDRFTLALDPRRLEGFAFGGLDGDAPRVGLVIATARAYHEGRRHGLDLGVRLGFELVEGSPRFLDGTWRFALDTATLSFVPGAAIRFGASGVDFEAAGFHVRGLRSFGARWDSGQLALSTGDLEVWFRGISEPDDDGAGFRLHASHLGIGPGGVDLDMTVSGGSARLMGIGDSFKATHGSIRLVNSRLEAGAITAQGALPWFDNATGALTLIFGENLRLVQASADFKLGNFQRSAWWVELGLEAVRIELRFQGGAPTLIIMITGSLTFRPEVGAGSLLEYFDNLRLEFKDLILTRRFDQLPAGLSLYRPLTKPLALPSFFDVFEMELRGLGIAAGSEVGGAALLVGGQVFFSFSDEVDLDIELHRLQIERPAPGSWLPRLKLEGLRVRLTVECAFRLDGFVSFFERADRKGFAGGAHLQLADSFGFGAMVEWVRVARPVDGELLRVWMAFAEVNEIDVPLVFGLFLRDIGVGFGWRKRIALLEDPDLLHRHDRGGKTIAPHRFSSWVDDLEVPGGEPRWTLVLAGWITVGVTPRNLPGVVGDLILAIQSDLTTVASIRAWLGPSLDGARADDGAHPPLITGMVLFLPAEHRVLGQFVTNIGGASDTLGPLSRALAVSVLVTLEIRPDLFRLDIGWPRQLILDLGFARAFAGVTIRISRSALSLGLSLELGVVFSTGYTIGFAAGPFSVFVDFGASLACGLYGLILIRLGLPSVFYGEVGFYASVSLHFGLRAELRIKLLFTTITIRMEFSLDFGIAISGRVRLGIGPGGAGIEGSVTVSARLWIFEVSGTVRLALNPGAIDSARDIFFSGLAAGDPVPPTARTRVLGHGTAPLPPVATQRTPRWSVFHMTRARDGAGTDVFVLVLPERDAWFTAPGAPIATPPAAGEPELRWPEAGPADRPDYRFTWTATGAQLVEHPAIAAGGVRRTGDEIAVEQRCRWNQGGADDSLGRWFYEEPEADGLIRQLAAVVAAFPPRLLWDRRVRADDDERSEAAAGMRPDVRSPCFDDDDDEHAVALRAACAALDDGGDPPSWRELAASMTRWPDYPDARKWQERRVGLIARLLTDFRAWARGGAPSALLAQSGLAWRFSAPGSTWRIALAALEVNRGEGPDRMTGSALSQPEITPGTAGLGFARQDRTVRIRDVMEFQDSEGIYLSWRLECVHEQDGFSHVLDHREAAGLDDVVGGCFELFDQFNVERHNLSSQGQADQSVERFAVRLGFLPTILDSGEFVLVAPRFELSDRFTVPADLGDLLVYRIAAIDTLGNSSQVVEHLTCRRNLTAPPAPAEATVGYELDLGPSGVIREQVSIEVTPSREMPSWAGGPVRYELWARSLALGAGFLGIDARLDESAQRGERTVVEPKGLAFVGATADRLVLAAAELERFAPGRAHELWVRAVSVEGSASRLVRCVHSAHLRCVGASAIDLGIQRQDYLERVPPPGAQLVSWVALDGLRCEVRPAAEPRPGGPGVVFERVDLPDDPRRDVFLRILHRRHVDDEFRHPTGGYEVIVRDRDATADDSPASYRRLAEIAIMGALEYRSRPLDTRALSSWHSRHLRPGERAAERGSLWWGEPAIFDPQRQPRLHYRLDALIAELGKPRAGVAWSVQVTGGAPADDQLRALTCTRLLDEHGEKQDPYGLGLLKRLGRSVDLSVTVGDQLVDFVALRGRLHEIVAADPAYGGYRVVLDLLVNGDGLTPMAYVRLSLEPRIDPLPDDDVAAGAARKESFEQLLRWLDAIAAGLGPETFARQGSQGAQARYDQLAARFLRKRPLDEGAGVAVAVTHLEEVGKLTRPLGADDTVAVAFRYQEPYARRFAYRVRRLSRYLSIYQRLGLWSDDAAPPPADQALNVRLSRREPPHVPVARFLGHVVRGGLPCSEWLVEEHQEEALVQSNETLRNRLGYRGVAWSLLTEVVPSWERWSGWGGDGWSTRGATPDDGGVPGLSSDEQVALAADAAWREPTPALPPDAGLAEHPFTDLLLPKGLIVRVPRLPYYYRYRLGVFARSDDVDSRVRVVDAAQVPPLRVPAVSPATAGWWIDGGDLALWWRIPSAWDSLDEIERAIWASERPFATRLWDFDLRYAIRIRRSGVLRPLLSIRLVAPTSDDAPPAYDVITHASHLSFARPGESERRSPPLGLASPYRPELRLGVRASDMMQGWMRAERDFAFELSCTRSYGSGAATTTMLRRAAEEAR